ncbi:DUF1788 domain-containing protein [Myxococcota bacterium]|nr:DUF1788 domain-containing protein [Myxococcota bacterium]
MRLFSEVSGIGSEIACYIFDYASDDELIVRKHIEWMMGRFNKHYKPMKVVHLNLFDVIIDYLKSRNLFDKVLEKEAKKGDLAVLKALKGPLAAEKLRDFIAGEYQLVDPDLVIMSGVGGMWPMMRAHNLLNSLHTVMGQTPLVMFYPGTFDGTTLKLFGQIETNTTRPGGKHYYRAFSLIPQEKQS